MSCGAQESSRVGSVADYDFVDNFFQTVAAGSNDGDQGYSIPKAFFDELAE